MSGRELVATDWRGYRMEQFPEGSWVPEADLLRAVGSAERVDLVTRERYRDFALSLEWSLPPGGNSGVLYRVSEDLPEAWQSGPEMQLLDDEGHPDGADPKTSCGALYGLLAPEEKELPRPRSWTSARVVVRGTRVEHWLDGRRVLEYDLSDERLRERVGKSKFGDFPGFGREVEGHVVLQHHGTEARFRSIRIEDAPRVRIRPEVHTRADGMA